LLRIGALRRIRVEDRRAAKEVIDVNLSDDHVSAADSALAKVRVCRMAGSEPAVQPDVLAVEEPLQIVVSMEEGGRLVRRSVSVTMRTPGHDAELAVGFLFTEGIINCRDDVSTVRACGRGNAARVEIRPGTKVDLARLQRHSFTSSSCGVCGKTSIDSVRVACHRALDRDRPVVEATVIHRLPSVLRGAQAVFEHTGGLHAAALFDVYGNLHCLREDVGRHNALDKVIGAQFLAGKTPLHESILLLSGRVGFELVQKAVVAGIPIVAAVGAPSSLAVRLAVEHGISVLGFVRDDRFNIYSGPERIRQATGISNVGAELVMAAV
jgi:FdhD protein